MISGLPSPATLDYILAPAFSFQKRKKKSFNRPDLGVFGKRAEFMPEGPGKGRGKGRD